MSNWFYIVANESGLFVGTHVNGFTGRLKRSLFADS